MFNVLIVDGDPMVAGLDRLFIGRVIDFHCCGVAVTIGDAKAMLSHLAQVDLLLLGVYMQQGNSLDLLPALRVDGRNIDVIMMTPAVDTFMLQTAPHYGVVDYLIKSFQFPRFEEALQAWRKKHEVMQAKSCYAQADIDTLLHRGTSQQENVRRLLKGLMPQTLRLVCQWTDDHQARDLSTNELVTVLQISRVSRRKYLIWLEQINVLFTTNHYGTTGRLEYRYWPVIENLMLLTRYSQ